MRTNRIVRSAVIGQGEQGPGYLTSLLSALGIGLFGAFITPVNPVVGIAALLVTLVVAGILLTSDRPQPGTYTMPGSDAMELLYAELDQRRSNGEILPFGNWHPMRRVLFEAQQADRTLFMTEVNATITRL